MLQTRSSLSSHVSVAPNISGILLCATCFGMPDGSCKRGRSASEHGARGGKALESSSHLHPPGWHEACAMATLSAQQVAQCDGVSDSVQMHPRGVTVTWAGDIQKLSKGMQLCSVFPGLPPFTTCPASLPACYRGTVSFQVPSSCCLVRDLACPMCSFGPAWTPGPASGMQSMPGSVPESHHAPSPTVFLTSSPHLCTPQTP